MAQRTVVRLTDDLNGAEIPAGKGETVTFSLDLHGRPRAAPAARRCLSECAAPGCCPSARPALASYVSSQGYT